MRKLIDLTRTLEHGQTGVDFDTKFTVDRDGWNAKTLHLYSHTGTHMDAPFHFEATNERIDEISLDRLLVPGHVVEIKINGPSQLLTCKDLSQLSEAVEPGDAVLLKTDWSQHFDDFDYFRNNLPRISEALANWLVERKVGIVGVEAQSVADVNNLSEVTLIHKILLGGNVVIVEGLVNLDSIVDDAFLFGAMPLKVGGGDGAPCRAFAMTGV